MLGDIKIIQIFSEPVPGPSKPSIATPGPSKPSVATPGPSYQQDSEDLFQSSPALSQIPHNSSINRRRLFGAASTPVAHRGVSTPVANRVGATTPLNIPEFDPSNVQDALLFDSIDGGSGNRKRRLGALFEDVFIPDQTDHIQKKLKNDEEKDENLIRLILDARLRNRNRFETKKGNEMLRVQELNDFKRKNLATVMPKWPSTCVTRNNGDRIYVRTHSAEFERKELEEIKMTISNASGSILGDQKEAIWESAREYLTKRMNEERNNGEQDVQEVRNIPNLMLKVTI